MYSHNNMLQPSSNAIYQAYDQSDAQSQALIEQVDPTYQPTQKQVKQYAVQTLGMILPRDQALLYLAKQGLKASLPPNWVPYQGRDGQVYYKHKITQQKTYDHPTDIEYRKKYQQSIQKMARKNLKSINLTNKSNIGFNPLSAPINSSLNNISNISIGGGFGVNNSLLRSQNQLASNSSFAVQQTQFSGAGDNTVTIDPQVQLKFEQQLEQLQNKLKRQYKQFQEQQNNTHLKRLTKLKQQFENNLKQILNNQYTTQNASEKHIQMQKDQIKSKLQKSLNDNYQRQIQQFQNDYQKKATQFQAFTEEDNKLKVFQHQQKRESQYETNVKKFQEKQIKLKKKCQQIKKQNQHVLQSKRQQFQQENNYQISKALQGSLNENIIQIQQQFKIKIQQKQNQLQKQYQNMRKMLGIDPNQIIKQIAEKKERLQSMSNQKLNSFKNKQLQLINQQFTKQLQKMKQEAQNKINSDIQLDINRLKKQNQQKYKSFKQRVNQDHQQLYRKGLRQIQQENQRKLSHYQMSMNQKISKIRDEAINKIQNKESIMTQDMRNKISLKQKEQQVLNIEKIIQNLKNQIVLERGLLRQLNIVKQLNHSTQDRLDTVLQKFIKQLHIVFKPQIYMTHKQKHARLRQKYKKDKDMLASIMLSLQKNSILPFYERQKHITGNYSGGNDIQLNSISSASATLIKKYNQDVRTMRKNDQMLRQYENVLRKAEINDTKAIKILEEQNFLESRNQRPKFFYEQILLKKDLQNQDNDPQNCGKSGIQQIDYDKYGKSQKFAVSSYSIGEGNIENVLQSHSKFLANVRSELNKKLYQIRSHGYSYY